jgi:hypothetical protein
MPVYNTAVVVGGFDQIIDDWAWGDDQQFAGDVQLSPQPPPPTDLSLTDAYFTLKQAPNPAIPDADALIQVHITQVSSVGGIISAGLGGALSNLLIKISSGSYQGINSIVPGAQYLWDIRVITTAGVTFTVATGSMQFVPNETQTNKAGTPAAFPNDGQPRFRGFIDQNPNGVPGLTSIFNAGDFYFNSNPINGNGVGWQCFIGGAPGTWEAMGLSLTALIPDPHFKGYIAAAPTVGTYVTDDWYWNLNPASAQPERWVCTASGTPGTWRTGGIVGDTDGS